MILIKQVGVYLNLVHFKYKQYFTDVFKQHGIDLTPEQFLMIDMLWKQDCISQQKLADILMKDKNSVTKLIDAMEKKGLVVRIPDECDRRLNLIALTDKAKAMEGPVTEIALKVGNDIISDISEKDLTTFIDVLTKISRNATEPLQ